MSLRDIEFNHIHDDDGTIEYDGKVYEAGEYMVGKYFVFLPISDSLAYKIKKKPTEDKNRRFYYYVDKVIKLQTLFNEHGLAGKCFPEIIEFKDKNDLTYFGYITENIHNMEHVENILSIPKLKTYRALRMIHKDTGINYKSEFDLFLKKIQDVIDKYSITRKNVSIIGELDKVENFKLTQDGFKMVDIDHKIQIDLKYIEEIQMEEDKKLEDIITKIKKEGTFPFHRRSVQYQSLSEDDVKGIRDMKSRMELMQIPEQDGFSALDIGCSMGMVLHHCSKIGGGRLVGIDYQQECVDVANEYFQYKGINNIDIHQYDISSDQPVSEVIGEEKFDFVFALSIIKHVNGDKLFDIINTYAKKYIWFEGHAKNPVERIKRILNEGIDNIDMIIFLGYMEDRGKRPNFLIILK